MTTQQHKQNLLRPVHRIRELAEQIKHIAATNGTPFYLFDKLALERSASEFLVEFNRHIPRFKAFYAVKMNHYDGLVEAIISNGYGLDVASGRELQIALRHKCEDILFTAPGKTRAELELAVTHNKQVRINIDSFTELETLKEITSRKRTNIRVGVRFHIPEHGSWSKYGIALRDLSRFWANVSNADFISLEGIHFHTSRNGSALPYIATIKILAEYLKANFTAEQLSEIKYIDFGGGFEPYLSEGYYPVEAAGNLPDKGTKFIIRDALPIAEYARQIGMAINAHLKPLLHAEYYAEPGRVLCSEAMHIIQSVVDVKNPEMVITDAGVNMVGWQRFEYEYFPLVNITHDGDEELRCLIYGNLCTPWDLWGYGCYANTIEVGDIITVPNQGAMTYSLAQSFIKEIPPVHHTSP